MNIFNQINQVGMKTIYGQSMDGMTYESTANLFFS